ncbi:MAG: MFS transporter [Firmicutes bacterium]|nr:MFS transporter [Bacillota bacterium]
MSILARVFSAVHFALIPTVVHEGDLQRANSVSSFTTNAAYAAGSFLSALLIAKLGWASIIIMTVGFFGGGAVLSCILPTTPTAPAIVHGSILGRTVKSLRSAIDIVRAAPRIMVCMTLAAVASLVCGTVSLLPVYIKNELGKTVIQYGLVEGLSVVGAVLSSLILARVIVTHPYRAMQVSVAAIACAVLWFGTGLHVLTLVVARMIIALALGVFNILFVTEFHRLLPSDYRGRVFSLSYIVSTVPYMLATAGAGTAAEFVPFWVVWTVAGCIGLAGVGFCSWFLCKAHEVSKARLQSQIYRE